MPPQFMEKEKLFEILRCALSNQPYTDSLSASEFHEVLKQAEEQAVFGIVFDAIKGIKVDGVDRIAICEAVGLSEQIKQQNRIVNHRAEMLSGILSHWNCKTCVLKGQGVAQLYPEPLLRQSGDIDIWVDGTQNDTVTKLRNNYIGIRNIDYVHSGCAFFDDVEVEVHFRPSWMYNPFKNKKLQKFFKENAKEQFGNVDANVGFTYPTIQFNLVYSLIHINRHIFEEGIGLRQLCDYYYILRHSTKEERDKALAVMIDLGLRKFVGAIMYIEDVVLGIDKKMMLCLPNEGEGRFLLEEIMRGGNFGHYDERNRFYSANDRFRRGLFTLRRNLRYLRHYPSEVLWKPLWQIWHWCWRKCKGYL